MAVRVRKLARQLGRSPVEVLGLLHALGFTRYKSPEDMVADPVAGKARTAARQGIRPVPVEVESVRKATPAEAPESGAKANLMASLMPGVEPLDGKKAPQAKKAPPTSTAAPAQKGAGPPAPVADGSIEEIARLRASAEAAHDARDKALQAVAAAEAARDRALAERDAALAARDDALAAPAAIESGEQGDGSEARLDALFEARGLRGRDEHARALEALVAARRIEPASLVARDPEALAALLRDRVLLFDGDVPGKLSGVVGVGVSPDRADLPGASKLARLVERVGELLLLNGWKQIRAVGVPPRWHGFLKHQLDQRVDLHLVPGGPRTAETAARDVHGVDVVWLWAVEGDDGAREAWAVAPLLVEGPDDPGKALQALVDGLESL